jgi:hypothetical protein
MSTSAWGLEETTEMDPSVAELMTDILPPNTTLNAVPSPVEIFGRLESGFDSTFSGLTGGSVTNNGGSNQGGCGFEEVFTFSSAADVTASFPLDNGSSGLPGNANPVKNSSDELDGDVTPTSSLAHTPSSTHLSLTPREQCGCGVEGHCPFLQCPNTIYIDDGDVMDMPFVSMSKMAARSGGSKSKKASLSAGAWMLRVGRKPKTIMKKAKIRGLNRSPGDVRASIMCLPWKTQYCFSSSRKKSERQRGSTRPSRPASAMFAPEKQRISVFLFAQTSPKGHAEKSPAKSAMLNMALEDLRVQQKDPA